MKKLAETRSKSTEKTKRKFKNLFRLKHEVSKLEPHLIASESLYDAQLKKKAIEIEIQMTTLKQKIEMMDNFKGMKAETLHKIENAKSQEEKIVARLRKITDKED